MRPGSAPGLPASVRQAPARHATRANANADRLESRADLQGCLRPLRPVRRRQVSGQPIYDDAKANASAGHRRPRAELQVLRALALDCELP
eukprot:12185520-Alexandrium_andersonii.AAC.1